MAFYGVLVATGERDPQKQRQMKRLGNIYEDIISIDNLLLADKKARAGKSKQWGIIQFDKNFDQNIMDIYRELANGSYKTSEYKHRTIYEPKERLISILRYRDRVVQHAIMNQLESMFVANLTADTYSCVKGRGTHRASFKLRKYLKDVEGTTFCLKIDIRKYYPNVDHDILKAKLKRKIKDPELLALLFGIIDSAPGLPIGNLLSQYFANFYLSDFDHILKEKGKLKYYLRYLDDIVILAPDTEYLRQVLSWIRKHLNEVLKLDINPKWQIFKVAAQHRAPGRGIDFVGYVHYHEHVRLRKRIKVAFAKVAARRRKSKQPNTFNASLAAYRGWSKHCNSRNLLNKLINEKI